MDNLKDLSYPSKEILLSIVENQMMESRKARGLDFNETTKEDLFKKPSEFDLPLNESLNIVKDYLNNNQPVGSVLNNTENPQEI